MAKVRAKAGQKLDNQSIKNMLSKENLTWKQQCDMLNIAHNKPRLTRIVQEYNSYLQLQDKLYKENSRKPFSKSDISYIIVEVLVGNSISSIAQNLYRPVSAVKNIINRVGIPRKDSSNDYFSPSLIPDQCISQSFQDGQIVWSAQYQGLGIINKHKKGSVYSVYILQPLDWDKVDVLYVNLPRTNKWGGFNAYIPAHQLGSLRHLKIDYDIDLYKTFGVTK